MMRRGFTLIELLVAIVLAGVVALLVWSIAGTVAEARERVQRVQAEVRGRAALRAVLEDALRHAVRPAGPGETGLTLEDGADPTGLPRDRLTFVTAGGLAPLTPDVQWRIVVEVTGGRLELRAAPRALAGGTELIVRVSGVDALEVLALDDRGAWTREWRGRDLPRAVAVLPAAGASGSVAPLAVALPAGGREE